MVRIRIERMETDEGAWLAAEPDLAQPGGRVVQAQGARVGEHDAAYARLHGSVHQAQDGTVALRLSGEIETADLTQQIQAALT